MPWREITAEQYRTSDEAAGGYDEARVLDPDTGFYREVWDVGIDCDETGRVVIYTAAAEPLRVTRNHPIRVRKRKAADDHRRQT